MTVLQLLLYLTAFLLSLIFAGRLLSYVLSPLIPKLLPRSWGKVNLRLPELTLLRAQGLSVNAEERLIESIKVKDICLFREVEWYRTFMRWMFEMAFPLGIRGIRVVLSWNAWLAAKQPASPVNAPPATKVKKRRRLRLAPWAWRLFFRLLSRILINIADVRIEIKVRLSTRDIIAQARYFYMQDLGVVVELENLAVVFNSERDFPCRAAIKAKNLKCSFSEENTEGTRFFELSDVAGTATIKVTRLATFPEWHMLKVVLGTTVIDINDDLIEKTFEFIKQLPDKVTTPKTKGLKSKSKSAFNEFLPQRIRGGIHKLCVSYTDEESMSALNSSLVLHTLQLTTETSVADAQMRLEGGIKKIDIHVGKASDSTQAIHLSLPNSRVNCRFENGKEMMLINGIVEIASLLVSIDDDLIWNTIRAMKDRVEVWQFIARTPSNELQAFTSNISDNAIDPSLQHSSTHDILSLWKEDAFKDSASLDQVYRKFFGSGEVRLLEEAEDEEPTAEVIFDTTVEDQPSPLLQLAHMEWDIVFGVTGSVDIRFLRQSEDKDLLQFEIAGLRVYSELQQSFGQMQKAHLDMKMNVLRLKVFSEEDTPTMSTLVEIKTVAGTVEGPLRIEDEATIPLSLTLHCKGSVKNVLVEVTPLKLEKLLHLGAEIDKHVSIVGKRPTPSAGKSQMHPNQQNSSSILLKLQEWTAEVQKTEIVYQTYIQPIAAHCMEDKAPMWCCIEVKLSHTGVHSGIQQADCHLSAACLDIIWCFKEIERQEIPLLKVTGVAAHILKPHVVKSVEIIASKIAVEAEVDMLILAMQVTQDIISLKTQAQWLLGHTMSHSTRSYSQKNISASQISTRALPPVRVRKPALLSMSRSYISVKAAETTAKLHIADSDVVFLSVTESEVIADPCTQKINVDRLILAMNDSNVLECSEIYLNIKGCRFLSELQSATSLSPRSKTLRGPSENDLGIHRSQARRMSRNEIDDISTAESKESDNPITVDKHQLREWRMMGCEAMGIAEFVDEDSAGEDLLSFFALDISVDTAVVSLPHDQHLGRLILFTERWIAAISDLVSTKIADLSRTLGLTLSEGKRVAREGPADLIDISIATRHVAFRLDAHPLEAWMATHGQHLRETAILKHAWDNLVQDLQIDIKDRNEILAAENWSSSAVFSDYYRFCMKLKDESKSAMFHHGAYMCITAENVHALILVGDRKSPNIVRSTVKRIKELDSPTSDEITFAQVQPIYIVATAHSKIEGNFSGVDKPSAVIEKVDFCGLIARGRQLTHDPVTSTVSFKVGRWHEVKRELPVKGSRPPMKVYTDMTGKVTKLDANGGIGVEPVISQLAKAFTRLVPPSEVNSDGTMPEFSGHVLQSWDRIRYTWRGKMRVEIYQLTAAVAADTSSFVDVQTPRIELKAEKLNADVIAGGVLVDAVGLGIAVFDPSLRAAPEASLNDLPLCHWPHASIKILYSWLMPQGRSPLLHHAFPVVEQPDPVIRLEPVDLFKLFVGEGYTMEIHADFDQGMASDDPDPKIVMGEAQIRFLIRFFQLMENAPVRIRGCWKRGSYFFKKDKIKKCTTPELPLLLHRIVVSLKTSRLAVEHFVWEADDPSDHLLVTCNNVQFNGTWAFLDKIENANALREGRFVRKPRYREIDGVWRRVKNPNPLPDMEDLAVSATNVEGFLPDSHTVHPILIREAPDADADLTLFSLLSKTAGATEKGDALKPPDGIRGRILTAKTFDLKQQSGRSLANAESDVVQVLMPNGEIKRPLHIQLADVKVIMPLEVRNAVVGVFMHMLSAFTGPPRSATSVEKKISDCIPPEQLQERRADTPEDRGVAQSTDSQLLRELLRQNEEGTGLSPQLRRGTTMDDSEKVDPLPDNSKIILQLEFSNVQLSCLSSVSMGGVLVCLQSGILNEYFSESEQIQTMTLQLNQVQAYHVNTKIDPMNPIRWLDTANGSLMIPSDSRDILTQIVQPFEAELSDLHLMLLAQARNPGRAAEELKIHSSRIEALTTSEQFEMLVDVINSLATPPPPDIKLVRDTILGPTGSALEDTSEAISEAKATLYETYRGFNDLRQQAYELSLIAASDSTRGLTIEDISRSNATALLLSSVSSIDKDTLRCRKHIAFVQILLEEKIEVARKVCYQATCTLQDVRRHVAATNKHKKLYKSMNMQIVVDSVTWQLINRDRVFMISEIRNVVFKSFQNKDLSGESSVAVRRIEMRDTTGAVEPGSGLENGVVFSVLEATEPDEEILRGLAIRGNQTSSHVYYEHIEAWVHRFGLNFNEAIATELTAFFFPGSDDEIVRKREEDWARFGDNRRDLDPESEHSERMSRKDSLSYETRTKSSTFLEPLVYATLPDRERRLSFSDIPIVPPECDPLQLSAESTPIRSRRRRKKGLVKPRKMFFVHARFNKIVAHVTYVGRPFSFKGLTITLGMSEYNNLEGSWRGLFKKYRNGVIGSVIKSIATHEGRSYDPSSILLGDTKKDDKSQTTASKLLNRGRRFFKRKEKATVRDLSDDEDDEMRVDVVDEKGEQAGRDLLLGKM